MKTPKAANINIVLSSSVGTVSPIVSVIFIVVEELEELKEPKEPEVSEESVTGEFTLFIVIKELSNKVSLFTVKMYKSSG
jgi:hypothetical protein